MAEGPAVPVRDWLSWVAVWTLAAQAPMWVAVGIDALHERGDPTMGATPVAGWVPVLGAGLAVAVPAALLLSVVRAGAVQPRRAGLVLGGGTLGVAAVAWSGFVDQDTGPWYVGLSALAGGCALVAAGSTPAHQHGADGRWVGRIVAGALVLAGVVLLLSCWRGGAYWDWRGRSVPAYRLGLVVGLAQVALGLSAPWWVRRGAPALRWVLGPVAAVAGACALVPGASYFTDRGILYRWVEDEVAWDSGTPLLLAGSGLLAAAVAARRRREDLLGMSLAAATTAGLLALWQSDWGSVMV